MLVIDGHNLIPKIPGWSLRAIDDEEQLVQLLQRYTRVKRKPLLVFFDGAPVGQAGERKYGMVTARFVQLGKTADEAIHQHLLGLKKGARNVTVVTSDRMVQANARALGAAVLSSEDFARQLVDLHATLDMNAAKARGRGAGAALTSPPSPNAPAATGRELTEWYDLFGVDPTQAEKPIEPVKEKPKPAAKKPTRSQPDKRKHHGFPKKAGE